MNHEKYMSRCLQLAQKGIGTVRPNPSVGAVIVLNNKIIGEAYTSPYGGNHAEVNAIHSVKNKELLKNATIYVTLEPCSHYGKTPPCADLIVKMKIPNVVIGCLDTNSLVAGKGIERLKKEGFTLLNEKPKKGADNKLVAFVHPKTANGVLVELCQEIGK